MFDTVIVPLNGSPHAEMAIPFAAEEVRHHHAALVLMHVVPRPEPCASRVRRSGPAPVEAAWPTAETTTAEQAARRYLGDVRDRFALPLETDLEIEVGDPTARLLGEVARYRHPLVVMTTGDASGDVVPPLSEVVRRLLVAGDVAVLGVRHPATGDCADAEATTGVHAD